MFAWLLWPGKNLLLRVVMKCSMEKNVYVCVCVLYCHKKTCVLIQ